MTTTYLTIAGNVGRDPEVKSTSKGEVVEFTVAVNHTDGTTTWFRVSSWDADEGSVARSVRKGDTVAVNGKYVAREWEGKITHQLTAYNLTILDWERGGRKDALPF